MLDSFETGFWNDWGDLVTLVSVVAAALGLAFLAHRAWRLTLQARSSAHAESGATRLVEELAAAVRTASAQSDRNAQAIDSLEKRLHTIEALLRQVE